MNIVTNLFLGTVNAQNNANQPNMGPVNPGVAGGWSVGQTNVPTITPTVPPTPDNSINLVPLIVFLCLFGGVAVIGALYAAFGRKNNNQAQEKIPLNERNVPQNSDNHKNLVSVGSEKTGNELLTHVISNDGYDEVSI